ncbi:hypothetical protein CLCAR_1953 [Clostridium carboxidivorans P7]|nr:hypothetical protein CLCAR_1953 [Clostridium carboxidivorans P7]
MCRLHNILHLKYFVLILVFAQKSYTIFSSISYLFKAFKVFEGSFLKRKLQMSPSMSP